MYFYLHTHMILPHSNSNSDHALQFLGLPQLSLIDYIDFAEVPSSVRTNVSNNQNQNALFRCRHERIDATIDWRVNGSSNRIYFDIIDDFVRESDEVRVDTLTIPAIPVYNGTEVVCRARFYDPESIETTHPATLIITGWLK